MPQVGELRVEHKHRAGRHELTLTGELDVVTAPRLRAAVAEGEAADPKGELVIDLRRVVFMDSSGLRTVLAMWDECRERGRGFYVIPDRGPCMRLFELTGVLDELPLLPPDA